MKKETPEILVNRILELSKELEEIYPYSKDTTIEETIDYLSNLSGIVLAYRGQRGVDELNTVIRKLKDYSSDNT